MSQPARQTTLFRGIYEYQDPSGTLLAAKVPAMGTADLYSGTAVVVRPNQCALFIYQGKIADALFAGTHQIQSGNVPILTRLANWRFGFQSPLQCELVFVSGQQILGRRWGTPQPVLVHIKDYGAVPIRSYGNFNLSVSDPKKFYMQLMGTRASYSIDDIEVFVQGQIAELMPDVLKQITSFQELSSSYEKLSHTLEGALNRRLADYGVMSHELQILSALPSQEVLEAINAKDAMKVIGSQQDYLMYKAANSMSAVGGSGQAANDPMHMMMGLMLGKGVMAANERPVREAPPAAAPVPVAGAVFCSSCGARNASDGNFCSKCGKRLMK